MCVCMCNLCYLSVFGLFPLQLSPSVLWYCRVGLLTCKNRLPYILCWRGRETLHNLKMTADWQTSCQWRIAVILAGTAWYHVGDMTLCSSVWWSLYCCSLSTEVNSVWNWKTTSSCWPLSTDKNHQLPVVVDLPGCTRNLQLIHSKSKQQSLNSTSRVFAVALWPITDLLIYYVK